jgi:hypothetical protein
MSCRRPLLACSLAAAVAILSTGSGPSLPPRPRTGRRLRCGAGQRLARSYATYDTALAVALLADALVVTGADGRLKDKAGELADVRPAAGLRMHHFHTSEVRVEAYAGAAIVTGVADWALTYNGREATVRRRYTAVYVRGGPLGWQLAALHMGRAM